MRIQEESGLNFGDALEVATTRAKNELINRKEQPAPAASSGTTQQPPEEVRKRNALINELVREWPSIERDLRDASRSPELQAAKVPDKHGYWFLERVKKWGRANGKLATVRGVKAAHLDNVVGQLKAATTTHRMR